MSFGRLAGRPPAQPIAETSESRGKSSLVGLALFQIVTAGRIVGHLDATCAPFDDPVSVPLTAARTILSGCGLVKNLRPGQQPSETKRSSCFFRAAAHPLEPPAADPDVAGPCPVGARARARDVTTSPCRGDALLAQENSVEPSRSPPRVPPSRSPDFRRPSVPLSTALMAATRSPSPPRSRRGAKMPPIDPGP